MLKPKSCWVRSLSSHSDRAQSALNSDLLYKIIVYSFPVLLVVYFSCNLAISSLLVNNCNLRRIELFLHIFWLLNSQILLSSLFSCLTRPPLLPYTLAYSETLSNSVYSLHSLTTLNHLSITLSGFIVNQKFILIIFLLFHLNSFMVSEQQAPENIYCFRKSSLSKISL